MGRFWVQCRICSTCICSAHYCAFVCLYACSLVWSLVACTTHARGSHPCSASVFGQYMFALARCHQAFQHFAGLLAIAEIRFFLSGHRLYSWQPPAHLSSRLTSDSTILLVSVFFLGIKFHAEIVHFIQSAWPLGLY